MAQGSTGQHVGVAALVHHYASVYQHVLDPRWDLLGIVASGFTVLGSTTTMSAFMPSHEYPDPGYPRERRLSTSFSEQPRHSRTRRYCREGPVPLAGNTVVDQSARSLVHPHIFGGYSIFRHSKHTAHQVDVTMMIYPDLVAPRGIPACQNLARRIPHSDPIL